MDKSKNFLQKKNLFRLWMDSIHCYSRLEGDISSTDDMETTCDVLDPPVVIVGTWKDALTSESDEIQDVCRKNILLYTKHMAEDERGHIRGEVFISNTTDDKRVFQKIRQNILKVARTMRTWNKDYPLKFIQLEKSLHEKKKELPIIPFKKLEHIAEKTPMPLNGEELILYLKYHHKIRALVYFEDLPDHIILDTQWLSNAFKCIVTARPFRNESIRNQKRWEEFSSRGKLHSVVLEDILKEKQNLLFKHNKDHILKLMEKFDIIIRPDKSDEQVCYYVPCMIKAEPECGIYQMLNVTGDTCLKSTWMCFKFKFLPPHLMNHLIASLSRKYDVAEVRFTKEKQTERVFALFKGTTVFELDKATKLSKLLVTTIPNSIQIQILEFGKSAVFKKGMYGYINDFVTAEINKIIRRRFRMTNVHFTKKWECGLTSLDDVTGSNKFSEDQHTEYFCETCIRTHEWTNEWSDLQSKELSMSKNSQEVIRSNNQKETTSKTKAFPTKEEINFVKMAMIVLNVLTDALYDLLKQDKSNLRPRSDCDFTYLYDELRALNKHIPSKRWGGTWQNILTINIHTIGDDIERIRLTRNELQHSRTFILDDKRFNELHNIVVDIVKRFDQHIKPARLYTDNLIESFAKTFSADEVEALQEQIENEIQGFDRLFKIPFSFGLELIIDKRLDDKYSKLIQSNNIDNEGENSMMKEFVHICEWRKTYVKPMPPSVNLLIDAIRNGKDLRGRWLLSNFDFESYMWDVFQNILEVGNIRMAKALAWIITNKLFTKYKHTLSLKKFRIWPGFHCICKKKDIFRICSDQFEIIIESMETNQDIPDEFLGFKVRHLSYEKESKEAQNVQDCLSKHWKPEACCDNIVIPGKDAESVFNNHSNLSLICSSVLRSAGILDNHRIYNERCIQLYCTVKGMIPVGEKHFPSSICQYSTDVLEGCPLLATTVIKVGEKVGTLDSTGNYKSQGTLGGFIYHLGFQCFLTCAHVVFDLETLLGRIPSAIDRSGINVFMSEPTNNTLVNCGSVIRRVFDHSDKDKTSIDAALIMIKSAVKLDPNNIIDGFESSRSLTDLGLSSEDLKDICIDISSICNRPAEILCPGGFNKINQTVTVNHPEDYVELQFPPVGGQPQQGHSQPLMVGTTAHMQLSNTNLNGQRVFRMYNQLLLNIPLNLGDSGTCIYVMDLNKKTYCLGMAIAFLPFGQSIVTPLKEILKKFNQ